MRITKKDLEILVNTINELTNSPLESYSKNKQGKYTSNIGNFHLSGAYGGWQLQRICNASGGVTTITSGFVPKRELYQLLHAYIDGIKKGKE